MQWEELKNKSKKELEELLSENRNELRSLLFQAHGRQLKQVHKVGMVKKTIARISLALKELSRKDK
ncbi:MAG: 50S ribosomal protein L29 [Candidatus Magasanikbacteria bacterium]|nr:50S ribosomal protein L29 [Candidatus Magasanikbacteria bacterium]